MGLFSLDERRKEKELARDMNRWIRGEINDRDMERKWKIDRVKSEKDQKKKGSSSWW